MKAVKNKLLNIVLSVILVVCVVGVVGKVVDISGKSSEIEDLNSQIRDQKLKNNEYSSILEEENIEDFYRIIAEDQLGFAASDEIIYKDITGY